jgi:hypothetical protein
MRPLGRAKVWGLFFKPTGGHGGKAGSQGQKSG